MATWKTNPTEIAAGFSSPTDDDWHTYDAGLDSDWQSDSTGVAGIYDNRSGFDLTIGWRMKGSSDVFTFTLLAGFMVGFYCGVDGADEMEFYCEDWSEVDINVSFFFGPNATFFSAAKDKSQTTTGSYVEAIDVTAETAAGASHLIFQAYPTTDSTNTLGVRQGDSTTAIEDNVARGTGGMVSLQTGELFDMYISSTVLDFKILGYVDGDWTTDAANSTDISVTTGAWTDRSIHADAIGVILETEKAGGGGDSFSVRTESGSTEISGNISKTWIPLRCDSSGDVDIQGGSANVNTYWNFYSIAETGGGQALPPLVMHQHRLRRAS